MPRYSARNHGADRNAQNGAAGGQRHVAGLPHDQPCCAEADEQLAQSLEYLAHRGGRHVALALEKAPVGGNDADKKHCRRQCSDGGPSIGLLHEGGQLPAQQQHAAAAQDTDGQEYIEGRLVDPLDLGVVAEGLGFGDHPRHGHGQAGGGNGQQHRIDVIGGGEVAIAVVVDDVAQGDFVEGADDFDDQCGQGQHCRAMQEALLPDRLLIQMRSVLCSDRACGACCAQQAAWRGGAPRLLTGIAAPRPGIRGP